MSFESMFESPIPLRDAAEFFMKLKYAENMPQPPMAEEAQPSSDMDQSVEMQAPDMPTEVMGLAELARLKLQAALGYRVYSESLRDLTNTALGEHFKEHSENELEHADYLIRRIAVMHGPVELGQIEPPPPATDVQEILSVLMDAERELIAKLQEVHAMVGENPMKYELEAMMVLDQHHFDDLMQHQPAQAPVQSAGQVVPATKMAANDIQLPATAMGQQKPVEPMPALMGTAAGQQAKIAFQKAALAFTDKGHKFDAAEARMYKEVALKQVKLMRDFGTEPAYRTTEGKISRPTIMNALRFGTGVGHPVGLARHMDYVAKKHEAGRNAWNPFGGALTPVPEESGGTAGLFGSYGRVKTSAETVDPDTMSYLQEQQDAEQATNEAEEGYYRQRFQAAAQQLQATQAQLEQQQQEIQGLQEQAAQHQQESDAVLQQAQQTQQMASQTATQAHGVAAQAIQQNQLQSQELIQQMQLSANMRSAIDEMKQQLMQVAMQPSPPTTTVQQAFDMTAPPGMPVEGGQGMEGEGQMQDPSVDPAADPSGAQAAQPAQPQAQPPAQPKAQPAAAQSAKTAASRAQIAGGVLGGLAGGLGTFAESRSDPHAAQAKIRELEQREAAGGGFGVSLSLAKNRIMESGAEISRKNPVAATLGGTAIGALHGIAIGPAVERLSQNVGRLRAMR